MRTTVRLDEALLEQAKQEAARREQTLTALIEQGLRLILAQGQAPVRRQRAILPVSRAGGGLMPGIDLNDTASLEHLLQSTAKQQTLGAEESGSAEGGFGSPAT